MKRILALALIVGAVAGCVDAWGGAPRASHEPQVDLPAATGAELWIVERPAAGLAQSDDRPRGGALSAKRGDQIVPFPLKHTDVRGQISLYIGSVTVTQHYHNPYAEKIEAIYTFPLPDNAAVRDFVMTIGDRRIRGIIREREEARKIYLEARRQGHVASLLTQDRPNIFTQAVANIEPGKQIDVDITYHHTLAYSEGTYEFVFPMVVGPRYNPPGTTDGVGAVPAGAGGASGQKTEVQYLPPGVLTSHDISLQVDIDAGLPIEELESPSHRIEVEHSVGSRARVSLAAGDRIPNKDFVLRYRVGGRQVKAALATHRDESGGYFTLMLQPPLSLSDVSDTPREMVFVLDCSGSMDGEPIDKAKTALKNCLRRLRPGDTFQVVRFSDSSSQLGPAPVPATPRNIENALDYVDGLEGEGGTNMIDGIKAALDFPHDPRRFRIVAFLTDGYIGNDREIVGEVKKRLGESRLFSFGVGSSVNRYLLEGMARAGRGAVAYLQPGETDLRLVDDFFRRAERPAMTDIRVDWGGLKVEEVYPNPIPDLLVGRPVILTGRFGGRGRADVRVSGKIGGRPHEIALTLDADEPEVRHKSLGSVWARAKIAELYDRLSYVATPGELTPLILETALKYGILCDWTSFVAVDSMSKTSGESGTSIVQPVPMPKGVKYETTVEKK
jgi:Ca-activated chloride channel family protein